MDDPPSPLHLSHINKVPDVPLTIKDLPKDVLSLIAAGLSNRGPFAQTCKAFAELVRPFVIVSAAAGVPEGTLYARVEGCSLEGIGAALPQLREVRLVHCSGTLTLPAETTQRCLRLRLHESNMAALASCGAPPDSPHVAHRLELLFCGHVRIRDTFAPLTVTCPRGVLPPGAAALLLSASHVRLQGLRGPLPPMPATSHLELVGCSGMPSSLHLAAIQHLRLWACSGVASLAVPAAEYIDVSDCEALTMIADLPDVDVLRISICPALVRLGAMPVATDVFVEFCPSLPCLPALPAAHALVLRGCGSLEEVGLLPSVERAVVRRCHLLRDLPGLPKSARVRWLDTRQLE